MMDDREITVTYHTRPDRRTNQYIHDRTYRAAGFSFAFEARRMDDAKAFYIAWDDFLRGLDDCPEELGLIVRISTFDMRDKGKAIFCHVWTRDKAAVEKHVEVLDSFFEFFYESKDIAVSVHDMPSNADASRIEEARYRYQYLNWQISELTKERDGLVSYITRLEKSLDDIRSEYQDIP